MADEKYFRVEGDSDIFYYRESKLTPEQKMTLAVKGSRGVLDVSEVSEEQYLSFVDSNSTPPKVDHFELEPLPATITVEVATRLAEKENNERFAGEPIMKFSKRDGYHLCTLTPLPAGVTLRFLAVGRAGTVSRSAEYEVSLQTAAALRDALVEWGKKYDF